MTTNTRELALKRMQKQVEPLKEKFGSRRIERLIVSVRTAEPSAEAINMISSQAADLLKLEPSDELVQQVTKAIDRLFKSHLEQDIARYSVMKIAIVLMKRDEEFLKDLFSAYKQLSEINPLLFIGATYDSSFREILFFSSEGLAQWVEDGKALFCSGESTNIPEFTRYCSMVSVYADVSKYKISKSAVFLEEVQASLTIFAMHKFNRRLVAKKSKAHTPHVTEQDTISIYLPDHFESFPEKKDNEREYYMTTLHEGSHLALGSFVLELSTIAKTLEERGIVIKRIKFRENTDDLRVKSILLEKEGKEFLCTSLFHLLPLLADEKHSGFLKVLSNVLDDLRVDSFWIEEKAPGYCQDALRNTEFFMFDGKIRKLPSKFTASQFMEGLLFVSTFLALSENRKRFLDALGSGDASGLPQDEAGIVEKLRKMEPRVLSLALSCEEELLMLASSRERNSSSVFKASMEVYDKVRHILEDEKTNDIEGEGGKGRLEGMSGPLSLSDIDPDNVEFSLDPDIGVDLNELPDALRDKLKKKFDEKFKGMSEEDKEKLAEETAERTKGEMKEDRPEDRLPAPYHEEVTGKWDIELVDGKPIPEYVTVHLSEPQERKSEADALVAGNIRNVARMIMTRRNREVCDALYGEADPIAKEEWKRMRRMGMLLPRTYHLRDEIVRVRSLSVLAIADASGSTAWQLNGKRKIDYITASVHSLAEGLSGVPGIYFSYGFFNSNGRDNVRFYPGNAFNEPLRFIGVQPGDCGNRDGAIMRHAGKLLSGQRTDTKIALFVNDSMPADTDEYTGRRGVEDVRHALTQLKSDGILFFVVTVPPDERYYKDAFPSMEQYLDYLYLARTNYAVISSERELDRAFSAFVKGNLPKLRRTEHR